MKFSYYLPEVVCLLLFTGFSCLWVISLKEDKANSAQLSPLSALEKLIPQHEVQLLNANFSDQLYYDQLAQLQSEVEALVFEADVSETSEQLLKDYNETSLSYAQLSSMLKTSQRLISENTQFENAQLMEAIDNIRLNMFSFVSSPDKTDKAALIEQLINIDISDKQQDNWQHIQLVKLHSLFILDNYELTAANRRKLIGMPVVETIDQERALLQQQINKTAIKQSIGIFGAVSGLVLLVVVVIKRNQNALKKSSKMHQEFASSLLDMLGPDVEKELQAGRSRKDSRDKLPPGNRKTNR
ncbi:hypothetical protein OAM69_04815 [bacterium]|nr:hypothetical protein [bacterium]